MQKVQKKHAVQLMKKTRGVSASPPLALVLGIVCNGNRPEVRRRLRAWYAPWSGAVAAVFVLDRKWAERHGAEERDLVGTAVRRGKDAHCVDKAFGWWRIALRWKARWFAKTDDDALLGMADLLPLLSGLPIGQLAYGGAVSYTFLNETTRLADRRCWARSAGRALRLRSDPWCSGFGPYPFAGGPLELLSAEMLAWLAPRLVPRATDSCQFEDRLLGREVASHPGRVHLVNLMPTVGGMNVVTGRGEWRGPDSPVAAHWVKSRTRFERAADDFSSLRAVRSGPASVCTVASPEQGFCVSKGPGGGSFGSSGDVATLQLRLPCQSWATEFPSLADFPCCHAWLSCRGPRPTESPESKSRRRGTWAEWEKARNTRNRTLHAHAGCGESMGIKPPSVSDSILT